MSRLCSNLLLSLLIASSASAVTIDWTLVGNPGNTCEVNDDGMGGQGCFGAVGYAYKLGTYEVTNAQYAEFLNAVAASDPNGLYNTNMGFVPNPTHGGITRTGSSGSYDYNAIAGRESMPVNYVSFYDSLRFANWLHNGQPTGEQNNTTTEDGAYTITAQGIADNSITRNAGATIFLPSEDEWYKAAYYNALTTSYFTFPAGSDTQTACAAPTATANSANCENAVGDFTAVGSYPGSASPYGTFDQGGNLWEWNEAAINGFFRGIRSGSFNSTEEILAASTRFFLDPLDETNDGGIRLASLPEPSTGLLVIAGLLGIAGWRRAR
jgi:formylglycine-generating enzyme